MKDTENPLVLSFTNKAIENVKARLTNNHYEKRNANKIYFTFDRLMIDIKGVPFNNGNVCIGSTCEELETRFKWNLSNKNS